MWWILLDRFGGRGNELKAVIAHNAVTLFPDVQRSAKVGAPGLVNFITALAYHFCPSLPAAIAQAGASISANLCTSNTLTYLISNDQTPKMKAK